MATSRKVEILLRSIWRDLMDISTSSICCTWSISFAQKCHLTGTKVSGHLHNPMPLRGLIALAERRVMIVEYNRKTTPWSLPGKPTVLFRVEYNLTNMSDATAYAAESRVPEGLVGTIIPGVLATFFVFARFYSRGVLTKNLGVDDAWIALSWVLGITLTVLNCTFVRYGFGHHAAPQDVQYATTTARLSYASRIIYQLVLGTTKLGLCAFYLRVFQDRKSKITIYCLMVFVCLFTLPIEIYVIYQCLPGRFDGSGKPLACDSNSADLYVSAVCNILADSLLLIFVVPRIFGLKMATKQKTALLVVVSLGVLVIIAAIVRLIGVLKFNMSSDKTWDMANITTWSAVEVDMGLFCASAPVIKPLIRKLASNLLSSTGTPSNPSRHEYHNQSRIGIGLSANLSRKHDQLEDAFEMGSQTDLKVQHPELAHQGTHWDDSNSDEVVFPPESGKGAIVKTVSISVTSDKKERT